MMDLFSGIASYIVLKSRQMAAIAKDCAEAQTMIEELKGCTDPAQITAVLLLIDEITRMIAYPTSPLMAPRRTTWRLLSRTNRSKPPMGTSGTITSAWQAAQPTHACT